MTALSPIKHVDGQVIDCGGLRQDERKGLKDLELKFDKLGDDTSTLSQ